MNPRVARAMRAAHRQFADGGDVQPDNRSMFGRAADTAMDYAGRGLALGDLYTGGMLSSLAGLNPFTSYSDVMAAREKALAGVPRDAKALATEPINPVAAIFAGPMARTANKVMLRRAEELAAQNAPREQIWNETGWFQGPDKKWRFEIDDSASRFDPSAVTAKMPSRDDIAEDIVKGMGLPKTRLYNDAAVQKYAYTEADSRLGQYRNQAKGQPLPDALSHDEFFQAYPEAADVTIARDNLPNYYGTFRDNRITFGGGRNRLGEAEVDHRSTVLHEGQHKVQDIEDFGRGGNKEEFAGDAALAKAYDHAWIVANRVKSLGESPEKAAMYLADAPDGIGDARKLLDLATRYSQDELLALANKYKPENRYRALVGEVEARTVQKRMGMTPEQRRARPPWLDYDVPEAEQIVRQQ